MLKLDHFAIGCADLDSGVIMLNDMLETPPVVRAKHQLFGTHNALWRLETLGEPVYLELIAIDPEALNLQRRRWFGLDDAKIQAQFDHAPKLLTFVVNSPDIVMARGEMPVDPGAPVTVTRNNLKWQFSLHDDGRLVADGALPYVIEWAPGPKPVDNMAKQHIELVSMGGARLGELNMEFACALIETKAMLEIVLKLPSGKQICFSR